PGGEGNNIHAGGFALGSASLGRHRGRRLDCSNAAIQFGHNCFVRAGKSAQVDSSGSPSPTKPSGVLSAKFGPKAPKTPLNIPKGILSLITCMTLSCGPLTIRTSYDPKKNVDPIPGADKVNVTVMVRD